MLAETLAFNHISSPLYTTLHWFIKLQSRSIPRQDLLNYKFICNYLQNVTLIYYIAKLFHVHVEDKIFSIICKYVLQDDLQRFNEMYVFKVTWNFRQLLPFALAKFKAQTSGILRIQSPDTCIISKQTMSEKKFGQKRQSMEK